MRFVVLVVPKFLFMTKSHKARVMTSDRYELSANEIQTTIKARVY